MAGLYHALRGVSDIQLSASTFYRVRLHTNNRDYRVLLGICEMVFRYTSPDEMGEGVRFIDFLRDEVKMRRVFQAFITNFYRRRQQEYTVNAEAFQWYASMAHHSLEVGLPRLHTDVVLSNPTKKIVIDTKYTPQHFDKRFGKTMLRPSHVNQIFAYMQNVEARDHGNRPVEGILLYPATSNLFCLKWTLFGHALISATVNLSRTWREIEKELLLLIGIVEKNAAATV